MKFKLVCILISSAVLFLGCPDKGKKTGGDPAQPPAKGGEPQKQEEARKEDKKVDLTVDEEAKAAKAWYDKNKAKLK